jgi:hypothetical protein
LKSAYRYLVLLSLALLAAGVAAQGQVVSDSEAETRIFNELNRSREEVGKSALKLDPKLTQAARNHTELLVKHQSLSHQFPSEPSLTERLRAAGVFFTDAAENVGLNSELSDVNNMFLRSPGHRANMLNAVYDAVGIGVVQSGRDFWVTEDFAKLIPNLSAEQAEDEAAAAFEARWKETGAVPIKRVRLPALRSFACKVAQAGGKLQTTFTYEDRPAKEIIGFSTPDPSSLASQVRSVLDMAHLSAYAVGACTPQESGSTSQFWIVMAFF